MVTKIQTYVDDDVAKAIIDEATKDGVTQYRLVREILHTAFKPVVEENKKIATLPEDEPPKRTIKMRRRVLVG